MRRRPILCLRPRPEDTQGGVLRLRVAEDPFRVAAETGASGPWVRFVCSRVGCARFYDLHPVLERSVESPVLDWYTWRELAEHAVLESHWRAGTAAEVLSRLPYDPHRARLRLEWLGSLTFRVPAGARFSTSLVWRGAWLAAREPPDTLLSFLEEYTPGPRRTVKVTPGRAPLLADLAAACPLPPATCLAYALWLATKR